MKALKKLGISLAILVGVGLAGLAGYAATLTKQFNPLSTDAIVSGIHISDLSRKELLNLTHDPAETNVVVTEIDGKTESLIGGDVLANPLENDAFKTLVVRTALQKNNDISPINPLSSSDDDHTQLHFNMKGMDETVNELPSVTASNTTPTVNATGTYNPSKGSFDPVPEKIGTQVDKKLLVSAIQDRLTNAKDESDQKISLSKDKIYVNPTVTMGSAEQKKRIQALNDTLKSKITYKYGYDSTSIGGSTFGKWLTTNNEGTVVVDDKAFLAYLEDIATKDNLYQSKEEALKKKRVMTGYLINYNDEIATATDAIRKNTQIQRELPAFNVTIDDVATEYTAEYQPRLDQVKAECGPEFVYININDQFMWFYKDNNLVVATPVTTGTKYSHDTPKGKYSIDYKATNVVLRGPNGDGSRYASPVTYWLPFNGSIGIHDADGWRSSYGGDIYTYDGSHGCVNTPIEKVSVIYNNIDVDCPVVVD